MVASRKPIRISSVDFVNTHHSSSSSTQTKLVSVRLGSNLHIAIEPTLEGMQKSKKHFVISIEMHTAYCEGADSIRIPFHNIL